MMGSVRKGKTTLKVLRISAIARFFVVGCFLVMGSAQSPTGGQIAAEFEVASVKHSGDTGDLNKRPFRYYRYGPNATRWSCDLQLAAIIVEAFGRPKPSEISGPGWIRSERYEVEALYPKGTPVAAVQLMLRNMLESRLGLKWHYDEKEVPIYVLVAEGAPLTLAPGLTGFPKDTSAYGGLASMSGPVPLSPSSLNFSATNLNAP